MGEDLEDNLLYTYLKNKQECGVFTVQHLGFLISDTGEYIKRVFRRE